MHPPRGISNDIQPEAQMRQTIPIMQITCIEPVQQQQQQLHVQA